MGNGICIASKNFCLGKEGINTEIFYAFINLRVILFQTNCPIKNQYPRDINDYRKYGLLEEFIL